MTCCPDIQGCWEQVSNDQFHTASRGRKLIAPRACASAFVVNYTWAHSGLWNIAKYAETLFGTAAAEKTLTPSCCCCFAGECYPHLRSKRCSSPIPRTSKRSFRPPSSPQVRYTRLSVSLNACGRTAVKTEFCIAFRLGRTPPANLRDRQPPPPVRYRRPRQIPRQRRLAVFRYPLPARAKSDRRTTIPSEPSTRRHPPGPSRAAPPPPNRALLHLPPEPVLRVPRRARRPARAAPRPPAQTRPRRDAPAPAVGPLAARGTRARARVAPARCCDGARAADAVGRGCGGSNC